MRLRSTTTTTTRVSAATRGTRARHGGGCARTRGNVVVRGRERDDGEENVMTTMEKLAESIGVSLGPIGMTLQQGEKKSEKKTRERDGEESRNAMSKVEKLAESIGVSLGPIGMTLQQGAASKATKSSGKKDDDDEEEESERPKSIANMSTAEWREKFVKKDGTVDLWLEDEYNIASRKAGAVEADSLVNIENYAWKGMKTVDVNAPVRNVKVTDHESGELLELDVPEGRYILFEAEQQGWVLPNACRMGGCTKCAVKISKGSVEQPESLGLSKELRDQGYALLCVASATSDVECVTQDEEEVYMMQFGKSFAEMALDKNSNSVVRDDYAFEIADMDE